MRYKIGYFNADDMIEYLKELKNSNGKNGRKIAIFTDNCSIHKSQKVV